MWANWKQTQKPEDQDEATGQHANYLTTLKHEPLPNLNSSRVLDEEEEAAADERLICGVCALLVPLFRKCVQKHREQGISPLWCHKGYWHNSQITDRTPKVSYAIFFLKLKEGFRLGSPNWCLQAKIAPSRPVLKSSNLLIWLFLIIWDRSAGVWGSENNNNNNN